DRLTPTTFSGAHRRRSSFAREAGGERNQSMADSRVLIGAGDVMHWPLVKIISGTAFVFAGVAQAQAQGAAPSPAKPEMMESCPGLVAARQPLVTPAAFRRTALERGQARLTYVGHSTFLIESPQLVRIATDYNDYVKPTVLPDIATMNHAHTTHYSLS